MQSSLDSMCGIFAILNSYQIVCSADEDSCQTVFNEIVEYLSKKKILKGVLIGGMAFKEMDMVMKDVIYKYIPNQKLIWRSFKNPTTRVFWKSIQEHLTNEGNAVIIGTMGAEEHWSCAISATQKRLKLFDSGGIKYFWYKNCTTTVLDESKLILYPAQTYFLSRESI